MTKPIKWHVRPGKTQITLGIHPVWSESSLSAWRNIGFLASNWAHSEDWSDLEVAQADLSLSWAHMTFCWFCHVVAHFLLVLFCLGLWSSHFGKRLLVTFLTVCLYVHLCFFFHCPSSSRSGYKLRDTYHLCTYVTRAFTTGHTCDIFLDSNREIWIYR